MPVWKLVAFFEFLFLSFLALFFFLYKFNSPEYWSKSKCNIFKIKESSDILFFFFCLFFFGAGI
jgi:hypothetical protein